MLLVPHRRIHSTPPPISYEWTKHDDVLAPLIPNIVDYYPCEEDGREALVGLVNGYDLADPQGVASAAGKYNKCRQFDRANFEYFLFPVETYDLAALWASRIWTVSLWFKTSATGVNMAVLGNTDADDDGGMRIRVQNDSNRIRTQLFAADAVQVANAQSASSYADGNWHHLCVICNAHTTSLRQYVNGTLDGEDTDIGVALDNGLDTAIGRAGYPAWNYGGELDEICIFNTAISIAQKTALADEAYLKVA